MIVHSDADLEYAAERCARGGFAFAGQSCISVQRIFVERVSSKLSRGCLAASQKLRLGDPSMNGLTSGR